MDEIFLMATPPIHADDLGPPPGSILLDPEGYFSDRTNSTTAEGFTQGDKRIMVTFWAAHPPRGSCFTVYSPDLEPSAFGGEPKILAMEDDIVLLRVPICSRGGCYLKSRNNDYFVYQVGTQNKAPSLQRIPKPPVPVMFTSDLNAGLLRCRDRDMYFVAILCWTYSQLGQYNLHLYSSKTNTWSTKLMCLDFPEEILEYSYPNKVITIGGELGSVGWVDLWQGILICDVLLDNRELRYIPLPSPLVPMPRKCTPLRARDIIALNGCIKFFEMHIHFGPGQVTEGWEAALWIRNDSWKNWERDCIIRVPKDPAHAQVLPNLQEEAGTKEPPILKGLYSGYPVLSLHDVDVVYIMERHDIVGKNTSVIVVDMRNQTVKGVADFLSGRPLGYSYVCIGSGISKHLHWTFTTTTRGNADEASKLGIAQAFASKKLQAGEGVQAASVEEDVGPRKGGHGIASGF